MYAKWSNGPDPTGAASFFPIGVWEPSSGSYPAAYQKLGITLAIDEQGALTGFTGCTNASGATTNACDYDAGPGSGQFGISPPYNTDGQGSSMYDEADMNQVNYGTNNELTAPKFSTDAADLRAADPTRPVYNNFGKCFSEPGWNGCQLGKQSPAASSVDSMTAQYCANIDIVSADYYGYTDPYDATGGAHHYGAWTYGADVANVHAICGASKPVLNFVETGTPFSVSNNTITAAQITAATWDGILHGANGVIYFDHDFGGPQQSDNALIDGPQRTTVAPTVAANNAEITALAGWLNATSLPGVSVSSTGGVPVTTMLKNYNGHTYLFAQADGSQSLTGSGSTTAAFNVPVSSGSAVVYGENRSVSDAGGALTDSFAPYQVHIYELS